jgi:hypothetical protein
MTERLRTFLLVAILMVATAGATAGILDLRDHQARPVVVQVGQEAPAEWHGWRLIPPSDVEESCDSDGYDACSDGGDDGEPIESSDDNPPLAI